jgi:hypothetical protein
MIITLRHCFFNIAPTAFLFLLASCVQSQTGGGRQREVSVTLYIQYHSQYCGGARPSDEILQELEEKQPYAEKSVYLRLGRTNNNMEAPFKVLKTDKSGKVRVKLLPNTYCLVAEHKNKWIPNQNVEIENNEKRCLEWQRACDAVFTILAEASKEASKVDIPIEIFFTCNPCYPPAP